MRTLRRYACPRSEANVVALTGNVERQRKPLAALVMGGVRRWVAYDDLASIWGTESHMQYVKNGMGHLTATPHITVNGDNAEAVGYSIVVMRDEDRCASISRWTLTRTAEGWRMVERYNRLLDGSDGSHETMRRVVG